MRVEGFASESTTMRTFVWRGPIERNVDCGKTSFDRALSRAWYVAMILTGSVRLAEGAVSEAIDLWNLKADTEDKLWLFAVAASLRCPAAPGLANRVELESVIGQLPVELQEIARHPFIARKCFILRFLVGWSTGVCASILALSREEVNDHTSAVLRRLSVRGC